MSAGSASDELHPVIRVVSEVFGPVVGPLIGKLGQVLAVLLMAVTFRRFARVILVLVTAIYFYAAWFNVWGWAIYTPVFLRVFGV